LFCIVSCGVVFISSYKKNSTGICEYLEKNENNISKFLNNRYFFKSTKESLIEISKEEVITYLKEKEC